MTPGELAVQSHGGRRKEMPPEHPVPHPGARRVSSPRGRRRMPAELPARFKRRLHRRPGQTATAPRHSPRPDLAVAA
jgi:hypothetical protein